MAGGGLNSLDAIESKLDKLLAKVKQVDSLLSGSYSSTGAGMGSFSTAAKGSGNSVMPSSLAQVPGFTEMSGGLQGMAAALGKTFGGIGTIAGGIAMMMPSVAATITRESGYYGAGVMSGALVSRAQLQRQTRLGLGEFTTSAGSDAAVAALLVSRGVVPGSADYLRTVAGVAGAARYLNQPNEVAAASMAATTMGQSSARFLRMGIFTADPRTGEKFSEAQIFEQIYQRATAGRGPGTIEQTLESLNRGFLGGVVREFGQGDAAREARISQYFIDKASGLNVDLSDAESLDQAVRRNENMGYENPFLSAYKVASKETENMEAATAVYIQGIKDATNVLVDLKDFTRTNLIPTFGQFNAAMQMFLGNTTGQGALTSAGGVAGTVGGLGSLVAQGVITAAAAKMFFGSGGTAAIAQKAGPLLKSAGRFAGKAVPVLGTALAGASQFSSASSGRGFNFGEALFSTGMSALAGFAVGGPTGALLAGGAALLGNVGGYALGSMFGEGGSGATGTASSGRSLTDSTTTASGSSGFRLGRPVPGRITAKFNQKYSSFDPNRLVWPDGHRGIDFEANAGQPVMAAASGMASSHTGDGFGNYVKIRHDNGMYTYYAHLSRAVVRGKYVSRGEVIGFVGSTGRSSAPHLHFALSRTDSTSHPNVIDPVPYLDGAAGYADGVQASNQTSATTSLNQSAGVSASAPQSTFSQLSQGASYAVSASSSMYSSLANSGLSSGSTFATVSPYSAASYYRGEGGAGAVMRGGNNVSINLSIAKASEDEARRFASWLKDYLEEEKLTDRMGAN